MNRREDKNWGARILTFACASAVVATFIATHIFMRWSTWPHAILDSDMGVIVTFGALATPVAALIGIHLLNRRTKNSDLTLQHQQEIADRDQFIKGSDLLSSESVGSRVAGAHLLARLGQEEPAQFFVPVANTFIAFLAAADRTSFDVVVSLNKSDRPDWSKLAETPMDVTVALHYLGRMRNQVDLVWHADVFGSGDSAVLLKLPSVAVMLDECNFSSCDFRKWYFAMTTFQRCNLQGAKLSGSANFTLSFKNCDLRNARIDLKSAGAEGTPTQGAIMLSDCEIDGLLVNGEVAKEGLLKLPCSNLMPVIDLPKFSLKQSDAMASSSITHVDSPPDLHHPLWAGGHMIPILGKLGAAKPGKMIH